MRVELKRRQGRAARHVEYLGPIVWALDKRFFSAWRSIATRIVSAFTSVTSSYGSGSRMDLPNHCSRTHFADRLDSGISLLGEFVALFGVLSGSLARSSHASRRVAMQLQSFRFSPPAKGAAS